MSTGKRKTKILTTSIPLFASAGYDGVSMRQIARYVGIQPSSLYHHFPDKQSLYIQALNQSFTQYAHFMSAAFASPIDHEDRLRLLIRNLCTLMSEDSNFNRLMQREILAGVQERLQLLIDTIFGDHLKDMEKLCLSLAPDMDPHLLTVSIMGLVVYHFQITPFRQFFPGVQASHNDPEVVAGHIFHLIKNGITKKVTQPVDKKEDCQ